MSMVHEEMTLSTASDRETAALGQRIGRHLTAGATVALVGNLGAGKTWLAKGLVRGVGEYDEELVKSPAFNLVHEYLIPRDGGILPVYHMDFYRLDELNDTDAILFGEYLDNPKAICIVEWADKFLAELVPSHLLIQIATSDDDANHRDFRIQKIGNDDRYEAVLKELAATETHGS